MQFAVKPAAAGVAEKFAQADIKGGVAEVFGKAQEVIKDSILPAAEAGVTRAKDKISGVNFDKAVADSVALSLPWPAPSMRLTQLCLLPRISCLEFTSKLVLRAPWRSPRTLWLPLALRLKR
jgi:hypothetical protein